MIKRGLLLMLTIVIASGLVLAGCSQPSTSTTTTTPAPAEKQEPITLLFATWESPEGGFYVEGIKAFAADLEKKTNGKVKVEFSWAQALGKTPEYYDLTVKGVCDAGFCVPFQAKGVFPMAEIASLPFHFPSAEIATKTAFELYQKGLLDKAFDENVKVLFLIGGMGNPLFTVKKPVTTLADMKGLKVRTSGGAYNDRVSAMGGVPVFIPGSESYLALERGTVGATLEDYGTIRTWKTCELLRYATEPPMGTVILAFLMNKDTYNRLPEDVRSVIDEMARNNEYGLIAAKTFGGLVEKGRQCFLDHGGTIVQWEPAALNELGQRFQPLWSKWIEEREAMGLPARQAVGEMWSLLKQQGVDPPAFGYSLSGQ
ncbi:MAG: TRAP transporter substrate-binding protein [Clostridia bacterium]|jgi:TRAP-type C4-dicarboxylate transport system substrate-binding protein|nr:TRAP transporter substrate-binding protein [Clostridia bacterium]MDH7573121.1 TRAP transporter substrate-binding protein [Clostridia bacterium]